MKQLKSIWEYIPLFTTVFEYREARAIFSAVHLYSVLIYHT